MGTSRVTIEGGAFVIRTGNLLTKFSSLESAAEQIALLHDAIGIRKLFERDWKAEIERLRDQHDTYVEMLEQLTRQLDAAAVLLRHPDRVKGGYYVVKNAPAYFLDGKFAGPTIRHVIRMAAKEG